MADIEESELVDEIVSALDTVGEVEGWIERRMDGTLEGTVLESAFCEVTRRLPGDAPPSTDQWEHLLVAAATFSARRNSRVGYEACKSAVDALNTVVQENRFETAVREDIVTIASALALVLTAQRKLRQMVELAVCSLCEKHTECLPQMAERCQNIWQRYGQMSGEDGLFIWDTRNNQWRLSQDFKSYCPDS